jgi:XTP/dITP diphosphohydrolase
MLATEAQFDGHILREPRGLNGFGYDPLFFIPSRNRTAAELSPEEKSHLSHRGLALRKLKPMLAKYGQAISP